MATPGPTFGGFTIDAPLDEGLACKRYAGHATRRDDSTLERAVAIAILDTPVTTDAQAAALRARCEPFSALGSPHVDEVLTLEIVDGRAAIVTTPARHPADRPARIATGSRPRPIGRDRHRSDATSRELGFADALLGPARLSRVLEGILAGLVALHARGIVHGAIHPSTIWLDDTGRCVCGSTGCTMMFAASSKAAPVWSGRPVSNS